MKKCFHHTQVSLPCSNVHHKPHNYTNKARIPAVSWDFFLFTTLYVHVCVLRLERSHECFSITSGDTLSNLWRDSGALSEKKEKIGRHYWEAEVSAFTSIYRSFKCIIFTISAERLWESWGLFLMLACYDITDRSSSSVFCRQKYDEFSIRFSRSVDLHTALLVLWCICGKKTWKFTS